LIDLPWLKYARLIFAIVSTTNIPNLLPQILEGASEQKYQGGHFWMPITPILGSILHAVSHAGHDEGGRAWGRIASLIETAKINGVKPFAYLKATLEAISTGHPKSRIDDLMPWNFKPSS